MRRYVVVAAFLLTAGAADANVNIETVPVGNQGNAGDTRYPIVGVSGFGAVVYAYNIGKYEVTAGQYTEFLNNVAGVDAYGLYNPSMWSSMYGCKIERSGGGTMGNPYAYAVASSAADRPVNYVSWGDAARFANWLHNNRPTGAQNLSTTEDGAYFLNGATTVPALMAVARKASATWVIPSEDEWYKAAYYKSGSSSAGYWDYPTRGNTAPRRDMADVSGNNANYYGPPYGPIDSPYYTTMAGEFQNSSSPYGTFDQGGNVWEWNETELYVSYRGLRGGSFNNNDYSLHASIRNNDSPSYENSIVGFRLALVPEPASIVLLALASLGIVGRRR